MILTVVDDDLFLDKIGYGSNKSYNGNKYEVHALCTFGFIRKRKKYLILFDDQLVWCPESKAVLITDDINKNWVFTSKYCQSFDSIGFGSMGKVTITLNNLFCYPWMLGNKNFFLNIIENNCEATLFLKKQLNDNKSYLY